MVLKCRFEQNEETHNYVQCTWYILFFMTLLRFKLGNKLHYCCNHISYCERRIAYNPYIVCLVYYSISKSEHRLKHFFLSIKNN